MEAGRVLYLSVHEATQAGEARRRVSALAARLGFGETDAGRAALLATEMATNLVKHARGGGHLLVQAVARGGVTGLELLALDKGPGMDNLARHLQDGFSTVGTSGTGLGAVTRVADAWDVHSLPGTGTALLARLWHGEAPPPAAAGGVSIPKPGQEVCGDAWSCHRAGALTSVVVADGLGHGPDAAEASNEAVRVFREGPARAPAEILERMHGALRGTRGAAVAVAHADAGAGEVRMAGIGNISVSVVRPGESRSLVSHGGIVGHEARKFQEFTAPWGPGAVLVLHSDGVGTRWDAGRYPGLLSRDPALLAGVLLRDFTRGNDDATVAAVRVPAGG